MDRTMRTSALPEEARLAAATCPDFPALVVVAETRVLALRTLKRRVALVEEALAEAYDITP